jgi:hypothetical protein
MARGIAVGAPLALLGVSAPGLERLAAAQLADGLRSPSGAISLQAAEVDVLVDGLSLRGVHLVGPGMRLHADSVRVQASTAGLSVIARGLDGDLAPRGPAQTDGDLSAQHERPNDDAARATLGGHVDAAAAQAGTADAQDRGAPNVGDDPPDPPDPLDRLRARLHGVPVSLVARGELRVTRGARGLRLTDPRVELSPRGEVDVRGRLALEDPTLPALTVEQLHAHTRAPLASTDTWRDAEWSLTGTIQLARAPLDTHEFTARSSGARPHDARGADRAAWTETQPRATRRPQPRCRSDSAPSSSAGARRSSSRATTAVKPRW